MSRGKIEDMKIILIGGTGMLGTDMKAQLETSGHAVISPSHQDLDITSENAIEETLSDYKDTDFLINCAAYTKVDDCEKKQPLAFDINGKAPGYLAQFCKENKMPMIHFSTDYVYDGTKNSPYNENDPPNPINVYGASKLEGEQSVQNTLDQYYIFRVQWLFGNHGWNFVETVKNATTPLSIVDDQKGSPTSTKDLSEWVAAVLSAKPNWGIYHLANSGYTSWYEFANAIQKKYALQNTITPTTSDTLTRPAKRPINSTLSIDKWNALGIKTPSSWEDALKGYS